MAVEGSQTQLRKQKRMRITSTREKILRKNRDKTIQCIETSAIVNDGMHSSFFINKKNVLSCGF